MVWKVAIVLVGMLLAGCGDLKRDNPLDPNADNHIGDLQDAIIGRWSLENEQENRVYHFAPNGNVSLTDYSNPGGGEVDRNGTYPQTLVRRFSGTYTLVGTLLNISFTDSFTNTTDVESPTVPSEPLIFEIVPRGSKTLEFKDRAGVSTTYNRL